MLSTEQTTLKKLFADQCTDPEKGFLFRLLSTTTVSENRLGGCATLQPLQLERPDTDTDDKGMAITVVSGNWPNVGCTASHRSVRAYRSCRIRPSIWSLVIADARPGQ